MIRMFIQERSGDYNFDRTYKDAVTAGNELYDMQHKNQGYWTSDQDNNMIWVPWHRVNYVKFETLK